MEWDGMLGPALLFSPCLAPALLTSTSTSPLTFHLPTPGDEDPELDCEDICEARAATERKKSNEDARVVREGYEERSKAESKVKKEDQSAEGLVALATKLRDRLNEVKSSIRRRSAIEEAIELEERGAWAEERAANGRTSAPMRNRETRESHIRLRREELGIGTSLDSREVWKIDMNPDYSKGLVDRSRQVRSRAE